MNFSPSDCNKSKCNIGRPSFEYRLLAYTFHPDCVTRKSMSLGKHEGCRNGEFSWSLRVILMESKRLTSVRGLVEILGLIKQSVDAIMRVFVITAFIRRPSRREFLCVQSWTTLKDMKYNKNSTLKDAAARNAPNSRGWGSWKCSWSLYHFVFPLCNVPCMCKMA